MGETKCNLPFSFYFFGRNVKFIRKCEVKNICLLQKRNRTEGKFHKYNFKTERKKTEL